MKTVKYMGYDYQVIGETDILITAIRGDGVTSVLQISFHELWGRVEVYYQSVVLTDQNIERITAERMSRYATI